MSKDYLCKNCKYNNNGWCTERKMQGLKSVTKCSVMDKMLYPAEPTNIIENNSDKYNQLGQRTMLWKIQRQMLAIDSDKKLSIEEKYDNLIQSITSLALMQDTNDKIFDIESILDSEIDADMISDSKRITMVFNNEYLKKI